MVGAVVAIGALGGTIAMTSTEDGGVVPTLSADELAAAVPGLTDVAEIRAETLAVVPSPSLDEPTVLRALIWARDAVAAGADGVVLTQGTDTLEETAYLLDLFWDLPEPLVVTGAMRSPQAAGADGPANLLAAVRTAIGPASRERGVLVVLDDEVHLARRVAKSDSMATGAFRSPVFGPIGRRVEGSIVYAAPATRPPPLLPSADGLAALLTGLLPRVPLVSTYLGDTGEVLDLVIGSRPDGIVVAGFGVGHVSEPTADAVERALAVAPVCFASRTGSGPTARTTYGYPGSEIDLLARGAVGAGWLSPVKARVLLWSLVLVGSTDRAQIADQLARRGGP